MTDEKMPEGAREKTVGLLNEKLQTGAVFAQAILKIARATGVGPVETLLGLEIAMRNIYKVMPNMKRTHEMIVPTIEKAMERGYLDVIKALVIDGEFGSTRFIECDYQTGTLRITESAGKKVSLDRLEECARAHAKGDWGRYVSPSDVKRNYENMRSGEGKIFSIYRIDPDKEDDSLDNRLYIITSADRSETVIMLPPEY